MMGSPPFLASTGSPQAAREHRHVSSGDVRGRLVPGARAGTATVRGIHSRVELVDTTLYLNKPVSNLDIDPGRWEDCGLRAASKPLSRDLLSANRTPWMPRARTSTAWAPCTEQETMSESSSPNNDFSPTETLFLRISGNAKGVLQVHRAPGFKWRCVCASHRWPTQSVSAVRFLSRMQSRHIASCFELKKSGSWPRGSSSSATGSRNCFCSALETRA